MPGEIQLVAQNQWPTAQKEWKDTDAYHAIGNKTTHKSSSIWIPGTKVWGKFHDECKINSWVYAQSPFDVSPQSCFIQKHLYLYKIGSHTCHWTHSLHMEGIWRN
jgi:hypothetical protein